MRPRRSAPRRHVRLIGLPAVLLVAGSMLGAGPRLTGSATTAPPVNESVSVPTGGSAGSAGTSSTTTLQAGTTYLLTVTGTFVYDSDGGFDGAPVGAGAQADAACENLPPDQTFERDRWLLLSPVLTGSVEHLATLYVNGQFVQWQAVSPTATGCSNTHQYTFSYTPSSTGPVSFRIEDDKYDHNIGTLTVTITFPAETLLETDVVPSNAPGGVHTTATLQAGTTYRLQASGTYFFNGGFSPTAPQADAGGCAGVVPAPFAPFPGPAETPTNPANHPLALYVDGAYPGWSPQTQVATPAALPASPVGCDLNHSYTTYYIPTATEQPSLGVNDSYYGDNGGLITVQVFQEGTPVSSLPVPGGGSVSPPHTSTAVAVTVPSESKVGANDPVPVVPGQTYLISVTGTYSYEAGQTADAGCSTTATSPLAYTPSATNYPTAQGFPAGDLQMVVNGQLVNWAPTDTQASSCSPTHSYAIEYVPSGPSLQFQIVDTYYGDNSGSLSVSVQHLKEAVVSAAQLDSTNASGAVIGPVVAGQTYRLDITGTYQFYTTGSPLDRADAACSTDYQAADPSFVRDRWFASTGQHWLTALVDGAFPNWTPDSGAAGCDPGHAYSTTFTPSISGTVDLRILSGNYNLDAGTLQAELFLEFGSS